MSLPGKPVKRYSSPDDPHAVYRIYDKFRRVIYIGCSVDPEARVVAHSMTADWRDEIETWAAEWYTDRAEARTAERAAIEAEDPDHNWQCTEIARIVNSSAMKDRRRVNAEARAARAQRIAAEKARLYRKIGSKKEAESQ